MGKSPENQPLAPAAGSGLAEWIATGFWVGHFPIASGTVGSVLGLPLAWGIEQIPSPTVAAVVIVVLCAVGVPIVNAALPRLGNRKDPGCVVYDEITSLPLTFFLIPMANWKIVALGFALNRLFDITKPPPARQLEKLPDGLGVMADDWAAGVFSWLALQACLHFFPSWTG